MSRASPATGARGFAPWPLFAAYLICTMAMMAFVALAGPIARTLALPAWQMGAVVTVGGLAWMLTARAWGRRSDRAGRRAVLLAGASGFLLSYGAMCALAVLALAQGWPAWGVFAGLVVTRGAAGAFFGAIPAAGQALVADHVPPDRRAGTMAMLGAANGAGLVLGPALAAGLALHGLALPLYVTAALPVVALFWLRRLPAGSAPGPDASVPALRLFDPRLRLPMLVAFTAMASVAVAQIVVGFFAIDRLGLSAEAGARTAGLALTTVGMALILTQLLVRRLGWTPVRLIRVGLPVAAAGCVGVALTAAQAGLIGGYFVMAAGMGLVFPAFAALAANRVDPGEQGAAAGCVGAAQAFGVVLGPLAGTLLYAFGPGTPYLVSGAALLALALGTFLVTGPMTGVPPVRESA